MSEYKAHRQIRGGHRKVVREGGNWGIFWPVEGCCANEDASSRTSFVRHMHAATVPQSNNALYRPTPHTRNAYLLSNDIALQLFLLFQLY